MIVRGLKDKKERWNSIANVYAKCKSSDAAATKSLAICSLKPLWCMPLETISANAVRKVDIPATMCEGNKKNINCEKK